MTTDNNPFRNLQRQFEHMQRQFEEALELWNVDGVETSTGDAETTVAMGTKPGMGIDLADRGDEFVLTADVPGFEKDDIELHLSDDTLHIAAEHEETDEREDDEFYIRSERQRRSLRRSVTLPDQVEEDAIEATYRNGVVTVTMPKRESTEPDGRTIDLE
ncbi:Hsp20/alpha crystallin family protein [Salinadaptatus halalkaliphilus]|uniref:Hsp20/alpha crystallin family protein n=1 Tax=Salinadaptatus halalkaliphilus TaxID=2419781 RepID=A0A4S3TK61_9EURY|nr:Hsp20/alpha crystallin family protein [Salinadaptatus halalkaliphilus]THE63950.1 Hsp20/alpha crystallin family protein [Salinadaptatus halalkaliphilus]